MAKIPGPVGEMDERYNEQNDIVGKEGSTGVPYRLRIEGHESGGNANITIWFGDEESLVEKAVVSGEAATTTSPEHVHAEIWALILKGAASYRSYRQKNV